MDSKIKIKFIFSQIVFLSIFWVSHVNFFGGGFEKINFNIFLDNLFFI